MAKHLSDPARKKLMES
jgi:hypothetical protein